jgi:hypothetical protein
MQTRLIDHLRDAAGDALDLFCDRYKEDATEADLIAALLHRTNSGGESVAKCCSVAFSIYQDQLYDNAIIDLGGTKRED